MKKPLVLFLCLGLLLSALSGCAADPASTASGSSSVSTPVSAAPVEVTFWHAMSGSNVEAMQKITDDFMALNKNIKVTLVSQGSYLDLFDKLMAAAKANQLPTISQVYSNRLSWYIAKDLVTDLTPFMQAAGTGFSNADYADIPQMFLDDGIWNGHQYAMPFNKSQMVLYYNVKMFADAGIEVPTTWDEWAEASRKLTVDSDNDGVPEIYGTIFANNLSTDIVPWLRQAGGDTMNEKTDELYFDTPETAEAIAFLNGMFQEKTARMAGEDRNANVPLQQGRAAMCIASTSALPTIERDTMEGIVLDAAALPGYKSNDQLFYGTNVTMFATAGKAEQQAGWDYLKFLINTKNTAYFAAMTGYIPVRRSAQDDPVFKAVLDAKPMKRLPFKYMDLGFQGNRNIGSINALDILGEELNEVFAGQKSIPDALKDAQKRGEQAMQQAKLS